MMYVLIVFFVASGSSSVAMHDFDNQSVCQEAATIAQGAPNDIRGDSKVWAYCVPKDGNSR